MWKGSYANTTSSEWSTPQSWLVSLALECIFVFMQCSHAKNNSVTAWDEEYMWHVDNEEKESRISSVVFPLSSSEETPHITINHLIYQKKQKKPLLIRICLFL